MFQTQKRVLERLREFNPDAVVTDLMMPRMDGMQFLARLRDEEGDRAPAVIVLTGHGNIDSAVITSARTWRLLVCREAHPPESLSRPIGPRRHTPAAGWPDTAIAWSGN